MNPDLIAGAILLATALPTGAYLLVKHWEIKARYEFQARKSKEYKQLRKEADQWRVAYEEEKAKTEDLNALLRVQRIVLSKAKVSDLKHDDGQRVKKGMEE